MYIYIYINIQWDIKYIFNVGEIFFIFLFLYLFTMHLLIDLSIYLNLFIYLVIYLLSYLSICWPPRQGIYFATVIT